MAMVVKNNMSAISTLNTLNRNSSALSKSLEKVSSGMKINGAADDASGYAISERMRVQIRSLDQANQNTQNGNSMMKTAEGAVSSTVEILKTLKEKVINAANDTNTDSDRATIQKELNQSIDQIDDNANITYNGKYLVDGSKQTIGQATNTALTNQALSTGTKMTTDLTNLKARNGDDLNIGLTDKVTVSYVAQGETYSTTFQVAEVDDITGDTEVHTLQDIFSKAEAIDASGRIFAQKDNASVAKALGLTDAQISNIASDITAASTALDTAITDVTTKKAALDTASADVGTKQTAYNNASDTLIASQNTVIDGYNNSQGASLADVDAVSDAVSDIYSTYTSDLAASNTAGIAAGTAKITDIAAKMGGGAGDTDTYAHAKTFVDAKIAAVGTNATALTTASDNLSDAVVAETTANTDYQTAKNDYRTAKNNYNTTAGPYLLEGKNVGVAASSDLVSTADRAAAITVTANKAGVHGQISGLNISITDSEGNVKKSANAALDAFNESVRAVNKSEDNAITLQVGAKANQAIKVGLTDMRSEALGLKGSDGTKLNIQTQTRANAAVNVLDNAIQKALDQQTTIGSIQSRLDYTSSNLTTASQNVQASESAIRDADMAKEMTNYTKNNVLLQAAQSMLAQANQNSSAVLSLLQ